MCGAFHFEGAPPCSCLCSFPRPVPVSAATPVLSFPSLSFPSLSFFPFFSAFCFLFFPGTRPRVTRAVRRSGGAKKGTRPLVGARLRWIRSWICHECVMSESRVSQGTCMGFLPGEVVLGGRPRVTPHFPPGSCAAGASTGAADPAAVPFLPASPETLAGSSETLTGLSMRFTPPLTPKSSVVTL